MTDKFLKFNTGAVYRYSERLAKRPGTIVVDGHTAASYFRDIGVENDITKKYPERAVDKGNPKSPRPKSRGKTRKESAEAKPATVVVTEDLKPADELEELLNTDVEDLLSGN